jgi:hypothetical protein
VDIHSGGDLIHPGAHRAISGRAGIDLRTYDPLKVFRSTRGLGTQNFVLAKGGLSQSNSLKGH